MFAWSSKSPSSNPSGERLAGTPCWNWRTCAVKSLVARFVHDESGATAIEYALIAALVAVGIIAAARGLGSQISATFNAVTAAMKST
jgi:pilus assembly protein Flp/PilA